jgi:hypothetical protein
MIDAIERCRAHYSDTENVWGLDAETILHIVIDAGMVPPLTRYWNSPNPRDVDAYGRPLVLQPSSNNGEWSNFWENE